MCDQFLHHECDLTSGTLIKEASPGSIVDPQRCQHYCETFSEKGCNYWLFESSFLEPSTCKLYDLTFSPEICSKRHGPQVPYYNDYCANNWYPTQFNIILFLNRYLDKVLLQRSSHTQYKGMFCNHSYVLLVEMKTLFLVSIYLSDNQFFDFI